LKVSPFANSAETILSVFHLELQRLEYPCKRTIDVLTVLAGQCLGLAEQIVHLVCVHIAKVFEYISMPTPFIKKYIGTAQLEAAGLICP
jgi:hypothetical protein